VLRFRCLASGSAGNATLVESFDGTTRTRLLVDCGLGWRQLLQRLDQCGLTPADIDGVFITHEHGDHVGCAPTLVARCHTPVYTSHGTFRAMQDAGYTGAARQVRDGDQVEIGGLAVLPFTVPHDAREPLQLRCTDGARTLGILTDLGHVTPHALQALARCHALMLESNHDPELLDASSYPPFLKRRVGGAHGHLSNAQAANALGELTHDALGHVVAAHLSERNNRPDLVRAGFAAVLGCNTRDVLVAERNGLAEGWLTA
jgi:phosphoribosyl 1,2-cyclic phosphodiesterase